ncbi:MAG TPA: hypothetical protein PLL76_22415, partial [Thermoanaerobaculia bacterium]|nr:hypothetical protein [Thermoanaerobaculia bacterium]
MWNRERSVKSLVRDHARATNPGLRGAPGTTRSVLRRSLRLRPVPKRADLKSILVLGSGPIVIGQACEFD